MKKLFRFTLLLIFIAGVISSSGDLFAFTVLVDPGHGGDDTGARGHRYIQKAGKNEEESVYEKDITLEIGKKIQKKLSKFTTAYLTRSLDRTVSLEHRAELAEKLKADLIISVHINSSLNSKSHGFETYYLDNSNDVAVKKVEEAENKNLIEGDMAVQHILIDLAVEQTVKTSRPFANMLHKTVQKKIRGYKVTNRGVKAGMFYVLALSKRPGVLLEAGFISNSNDLKKLLDLDFQDKYSEAVVESVMNFAKKYNRKGMSVL